MGQRPSLREKAQAVSLHLNRRDSCSGERGSSSWPLSHGIGVAPSFWASVSHPEKGEQELVPGVLLGHQRS